MHSRAGHARSYARGHLVRPRMGRLWWLSRESPRLKPGECQQDIKAFLNIKKIEYVEVPAGDTEYALSVNGALYNYNAALAWIDKQ